MTIKYKKFNGIDGEVASIKHTKEDGKVIYIPLDPANTSYQEYLEWLADGGVPEEADA